MNNNIQEAYVNNRYELLELSKSEGKKNVLDLHHSINTQRKDHFDEYTGVRPAGHFFAYNRQFVWVYLANNNSDAHIRMRHYTRGFFVTITTIDDSALYADWKDPLSDKQMADVLDYFNILAVDGLDSDSATLVDLQTIIGINASSVSFS